VRGLVERNLPGYAIGGLAGGEDKDSFWRVVAQCTAGLPENKPRYVMGVGYPLDIVVCSALGADMYDCVYPTRTARFGTALVPEGVLKLKQNAMATDERPIDPTCSCMVRLEPHQEPSEVIWQFSLLYNMVILPGLQKVYACIFTLPCNKRCYGLSTAVLSQFIIYDAVE